jgi:hypothetical protein
MSAMPGLLEGEGEGLEFLFGAEPDEAAVAGVDVGLAGRGVTGAHAAVEAIAGDHEIGAVFAGDGLVVADLALEHEPHPELLAARLQDVEQPLAADAAEAVPARGDGAALEVDVDVVPVIEGLQDGARGLFVRGDQLAQGLVGEHDAPAEGVAGPVTLDHRDVVRRILLLHQQAKIQAGGPAADANDVHDCSAGRSTACCASWRSLKRCSLPVSVRGKAVLNSIRRGYL